MWNISFSSFYRALVQKALAEVALDLYKPHFSSVCKSLKKSSFQLKLCTFSFKMKTFY